ncbi:MAG TPA: PAS domain-containing sensor histidine kinase [Longimicrobiales bacterium]|nr:PAS domain-containing sensor histidine kinase [Longimicrobiales bacterium]
MPDPAVVRPPKAPTLGRLRQVLDALEEGVAILGSDGVVEYVNRSGERILCLAPGEVLGCRLVDFRWEIVDLEGRPLPKESLPTLRALESGEPAGPMVVGMTSNAVPELAWIEVSSWPLRSPGGKGPPSTVTSFRDVTTRVRAQQGLRESEDRYSTLTQSVPVGIFHTDPVGAAVWVNPAMAGIIGLSFEESLGMGWARALHPADREGVFEAWRRASEAGGPYVREHRFVLPDGQVRWVICRAVRVKDGQGRFLGTVGSVTDVTEAKSAALLKDHVIGLVSHELRSPLISIRGALTFLEPHLRGAGEEARNLYDMALRNASFLERLVRDLLDVERLATGQLSLEMEALPVHDVLARAREVVLPEAMERGVTLREPAPAAARVTADMDRLVQVFTNLLSNAVKSSEPGGEVWMEVASEAGTVTVGVHDRGWGISPDDHHRIFEPFVQVEGGGAAGAGGAGLGLAIARAIVERHGGRIWVESAPGEGASFFVSLPES